MMLPLEQQKYYRDLWRSIGESVSTDDKIRARTITKALQQITQKIEKKDALRILDLGCGAGWLGEFLMPFGVVTAADFEKESLELATRKYPLIEFVVLDDEKENYGLQSDSFDIIIATEVLEHVVNKSQFLSFVRKILRQNGYLIITTPVGELFELWSSTMSGMMQPVELWLTMKQAKDLLNREGFEVISQKRFLYTPIGQSVFSKLMSTKMGYYIRRIPVLWPLLSNSFGIYQILVGRKADQNMTISCTHGAL